MSRISEAEGSTSSSSSSTTHTAIFQVDFGHQTTPYGENIIGSVQQVVSAIWVTANTVFTSQMFRLPTADHDPEDYYVEDLYPFVVSVTPGVGFTLECKAPITTWGKYFVSVIGVN